MSRPVKIVTWVLVFAACASAGAFVASRTDPFPPGVSDPGERPSVTTTPSPDPQDQTWLVQISSQTRHVLHVGGECRTSWEGTAEIQVSPQGAAEGSGEVLLQGDAECDTPVVQVQALGISLKVAGKLSSQGSLELTFKEAGRDPVGSRDLGGFVSTLSGMRPSSRHGEPVKLTLERADGNLGRYVSVTTFVASCVEGC